VVKPNDNTETKDAKKKADQAPGVGHQDNTARFRNVLHVAFPFCCLPPGRLRYRIRRGFGDSSIPSRDSTRPLRLGGHGNINTRAEPYSVPQYKEEAQGGLACSAARAIKAQMHPYQENRGYGRYWLDWQLTSAYSMENVDPL
jgi:hypothetical protein